MVRLDVLGPVLLTDGDGRPVAVGGKRPRAMLAALAARAARPATAGELTDAVWPTEPVPASINNAQVYIASLRRRTGRDLIATEDGGYRLGPTVELVHADFLAEVERAWAAVHTDPRTADAVATQCLRRWRGDPLPDCEDDPAVDELRRSLLRARATAWETLVLARLATGSHDGIAGLAERLTREDPLGERGWELYLRALRAEGRRAEALRAYDTVRRLLVRELGIAPSAALRMVHQEMLAEERLPGAMLWPGDVPPSPDPFVDRICELAELDRLTSTHRLVTVVGPGGVGKTRLVWEHLARHADVLRVTVTCSMARTGHEAVELIAAQVLVGPPAGPLAAAVTIVLRSLQPVLVLDNLEQVDGADEMVAGLLRDVAGLRVLVTSRSPLGLPSETVLPVAGLGFPTSDAAADVLASPAGTLFVIRARAVLPGFRLDGHAAAVAAICHRLDGLPLGLEIAAARMQLYQPDELARYVDSLVAAPRLDGTGTGRQVSVAATVEWSYRLLDDDAARALRHLAAFRGSATADSLAVLLGAEPERTAELLEDLARHSLAVRAEPGRYRLLSTVRAVALDKLRGAGEQYTALSRLDTWCLRSCQARIGGGGMPGFADSAGAVAFFDDESSEVRAALSRLAAVDQDRWVDLLLTCWGPWWQLGRTGELVPLLVRALDGVPRQHRRYADIQLCLGLLDANEGRLERAARLLDDLLGEPPRDLLRPVPPPSPREALARTFRAYVALSSGDVDAAERHAGVALGVAEGCGTAWVHAWSLLVRGAIEQERGAVDAMVESHEHARTVAREAGAAVVELGALTNLSEHLSAHGRESEATPLRVEALRLARELRYAELEALLVAGEARAALGAGRLDEARRAVDRCAATMLRVSHGRWLAELVDLQASVAAAEGDLARSAVLSAGHRAWVENAGWTLGEGMGGSSEERLRDVRPDVLDDGALRPMPDLVRLGMGAGQTRQRTVPGQGLPTATTTA